MQCLGDIAARELESLCVRCANAFFDKNVMKLIEAGL